MASEWAEEKAKEIVDSWDRKLSIVFEDGELELLDEKVASALDAAVEEKDARIKKLKEALIDDIRSLKFIPPISGLSLMKDAVEQSIKRIFALQALGEKEEG